MGKVSIKNPTVTERTYTGTSVEEYVDSCYQFIEEASANCFGKIPDRTYEKRMAFLSMLASKKHLSVFEHGRLSIQLSKGSFDILIASYHLTMRHHRHPLAFSVYEVLPEEGYLLTVNFRTLLEIFDISDTDGLTDNEQVSLSCLKLGLYTAAKVAKIDELLKIDLSPYYVQDLHSEESTNAFRVSIPKDSWQCIVATTRGVSAESNRNRTVAVTESSTRYIDFASDLPIQITSAMRDDPEAIRLVREHAERTADTYEILMGLGYTRQDARCVLPLCLETTLFISGTVWDKQMYKELRCAPSAHPDIQNIANKL